MNQSSERVLYVVAALSFMAALLWTGLTVSRFSSLQGHLARKQDDLDALARMEQVLARDRAAIAPFNTLSETRLTDPSSLLRNMAPDVRAEVRRREAVEAWNGWQSQRWEIQANRIPMEKAGTLLTVLEVQQPPWRLIEGAWVASDTEDGEGRMTLLIEGLEKR